MSSTPTNAGTGKRNQGRRRFLLGLGRSATGVTLLSLGIGLYSRQSASMPATSIRPPGALDESEFAAACIRCGLCVRADARASCDDCMDCYLVCPEQQVLRPALKGLARMSHRPPVVGAASTFARSMFFISEFVSIIPIHLGLTLNLTASPSSGV